MTNKGKKRRSEYKQVQFETAVRNPDRYISILRSIKNYDGCILNDDILLEIVSNLYLLGEFSSDEINISENTNLKDITDLVIKVNSTRNGDGGFPKGYASRFWTYMRTPSELGMIYARYNEPLLFSEVSKMLLAGVIDEQEAFSVQEMKCNRRSPYKNVSNDFNFFKLVLNTLSYLHDKGKQLSFEQFIVLMFNQSGNINETIELLLENKFPTEESVYNFVNEHYSNTLKPSTVLRDYPDVTRRLMIISGFITIKYKGIKFIEINEDKLDYIKELLSVEFSLTEDEKIDAKKYFLKLGTFDDKYFNIVKKYRVIDKIDGKGYTNKLVSLIKEYRITENNIIEGIHKIYERNNPIHPEFDIIPPPLRLEFFLSILIVLKYEKEFNIRPNYKADHLGKPYSHAPGNNGDIDIYSNEIYWLLEVTLIRTKQQLLNNETSTLIRHLNETEEFKNYQKKYLSLVAPIIHQDTENYFRISLIDNQMLDKKLSIKPYNIINFIDVTLKKNNFFDMESHSSRIFEDFKSKINLN
ncbi:MAG: AlwI family type II restriction endonuclease [Candidatus Nomurabacteria bacterium]|nr:AlwI family type II restriction endonuclease [Candidatus Nomurabacteria bacterium]